EEIEIIAARLRTNNTTQRLHIPSPHRLLRWRRTRRKAVRDGAFYEGMFGERLVTICQEIVDTCQPERKQRSGLFEYLIAARPGRILPEFVFLAAEHRSLNHLVRANKIASAAAT